MSGKGGSYTAGNSVADSVQGGGNLINAKHMHSRSEKINNSNMHTAGGAADRAMLRTTIREKDFLDDNATLLPDSIKPAHKVKPTKALTEAIEFRKRFNLERAAQRAEDFASNVAMSQSLQPAAILARATAANNDVEEEELVGAFMRGEHWIRNPAAEQFADTGREETFHNDSVRVLKESKELTQDFQDMHIGDVLIPKETQAEEAERVRQEAFIERINGRMELFSNYKSFTADVLRLNLTVSQQEEEILAIQAEVRLGVQLHGFEWQTIRNKRIIELTAKTVVDKEDLEYSKRRLVSIKDEIARKFPEMSSGIDISTGQSLDDPTDVDGDDGNAGTTVVKERDATNAFAEGVIPVYCWLVGRLTYEGKICNMLFGQFSKDVEPPSENWIFIGKNVDRNLISTSAAGVDDVDAGTGTGRGGKGNAGVSNNYAESTISTNNTSPSRHGGTSTRRESKRVGPVKTAEELAAEALSHEEMLIASEGGGGLTSHAEKDHVMSEKLMNDAKNDNIKVTKCININESYKAQIESTAPIKSTYYTLEGCSLEHLNGKYLDHGKACNVAKYRNTRGWVIYRCALLEIPDLGIFADNCYVATSKNTGVAEALDRRADYAFNDIVNRDFFGAPDGSVQFKRRFAEMSRSGQRVINVDQTMQIIRNENLKADMRSASDRALMMILTAVMGHRDPSAEEKEKLGPDGKPMSAAQQAEADQRAFRKLLGQPEDPLELADGGDEYGGTEEGKASGTGRGPDNLSTAQMQRRFAQGNNSMYNGGNVLAKVGFSLKTVPEGDGEESCDAERGMVDAEGNIIDMNEIDNDFDSVDDSTSITSHEDSVGSLGSDSRSSNGGKRTAKGRKRRAKFTRNIKASGTATESKTKDGEHGDNELSESINKIESGVDLDIKVTLSKGVHYQVGSQGYPLALSPVARAKSKAITGLALDTTLTEDQSKFLQEESYLSSLVTKMVEAREEEVFRLQIEEQKVTQVYLSTEGRLQTMNINGMLSDLMKQMRRVREATLKVAETHGAWARLCHNQKQAMKRGTSAVDLLSNPVNAKASRSFCVNIAVRGPEIYKASRKMTSTVSSKFGREEEKAKYATNIRYVGEYKTRDEAAAAFSMALASVEPQLRLTDSTGNEDEKILIGLRKCGKHYLARSSRVPSDLPCEACVAAGTCVNILCYVPCPTASCNTKLT